MDIKVARFREVLGLLKPVILRKPSLPVLSYVLLKDGQAVACSNRNLLSHDEGDPA
ncbi:hypothetical protein ES703_96675 [subsurface metagenome]